MSSNTYAIIGSGALGGFYGAKLQKAGLEVHLLLHSDYHHVLENGIVIKSKHGDFKLSQVNAYKNTNQMPKCDVILIGLKTTQNNLLAKFLPPLLKENTVVLLLQNGLSAEPEVAKIVGEQRLIGGISHLASNKLSFGYIHHIDDGSIRIGRYARNYQLAQITNKMREITHDFKISGVPVYFTENLLLER